MIIPTCGRIVHVLSAHGLKWKDADRWAMVVHSCDENGLCTGSVLEPRGAIWVEGVPHRSQPRDDNDLCWEWPAGTREANA